MMAILLAIRFNTTACSRKRSTAYFQVHLSSDGLHDLRYRLFPRTPRHSSRRAGCLPRMPTVNGSTGGDRLAVSARGNGFESVRRSRVRSTSASGINAVYSRWIHLSALLLLPLGMLVVGVASELSVVPENAWSASLIGQHAAFCVFFIPVLSLVPLAGLMLALRNSAPESPRLAGAVAGLAAGGIAAAIYAWHCPDDSPLFVAVWYVLAITIVTGVGTLIGGRILRW
jgi:hypothetical protein